MIVAIRGAITVESNAKEQILAGARQLLREILAQNELQQEQLISILFTMTPDLNAVFPAVAARELGIVDTPLMCAQEIAVKNSLARCIRVLLHCDGEKSKQQVKHIYLKGATSLRPDLSGGDR